MTASYEDASLWIDNARSAGKAFLIIGLDTFDFSNYPVPCSSADECLLKIATLRIAKMTEVEEIYDLNMDLELQLSENVAWHPPASRMSMRKKND